MLSVLDEDIISPCSLDGLALYRIEGSLPFDCIVVEIAFKNFPIGQLYFSLSMLGIIFELPFIIDPFFTQICEIVIIEGFYNGFRVIVENSAKAIELVVLPLPLICDLSIIIM